MEGRSTLRKMGVYAARFAVERDASTGSRSQTELQFTWSEQASLTAKYNWDASYQKLVEFNSRFGHCRVPAVWKEDRPFGRWAGRQRFLHSKGTLQPDREAKLNELQFSWSENARKDAKWDASYQKLVEFKRQFGHCRVPKNWKDDPALRNWVAQQRHLKSKGTLKPDREAKLEELQFSWSEQDIKWDVFFQKLVEFKSRFGHCDVPIIWKDDPALRNWVAQQRRLKSKGTLKPDREAKLKDLQFSWSEQDIKWDVFFQKLVEFKSRFGHCRVPTIWKDDLALGRWVNKQRVLHSKGTLQPDREAKLKDLQFSWSEQDIKWDVFFQKLVEFKSRFGHCNVPQNWKEDPTLGIWVRTQRALVSRGAIRPDRKAKLDELQFTWHKQASAVLSKPRI